MECFNVNNNSSDSNLPEGPVTRISKCPSCKNDVKYVGKYTVPHTLEGKEIDSKEFALHEDVCDGNFVLKIVEGILNMEAISKLELFGDVKVGRN